MWDDFGCINFAGGEVGHLIAFGKPSLKKGKILLGCCVFGLSGKSKKQIICLRYLSQNFSAAVALPSRRISDYPGHLRGRTAIIQSLPARFAGPLRRFAHAAAVSQSGPAISPYFHWRLVLQSRTKSEARSLISELLYPGTHPTPLSAALSLTSQCEMRALGLPDIDHPA